MAGAIFCCFFVLALCSGEVAGQSLQKLLDGGRTPSAQKPQMSAAEQKDWAAAKVAELQARESKADDLRSELRMANLPETRADEFLAALRESIRNYQLAADTLSAVVKRESPEGGLAPAPVALPKDEKEADGYRDRLAALRGPVQTAATQVQLDEDFLTRQRSTLKALGAQLRRIQEQFDTAESPAAQRSAGFELKLAEMQQESASSAAFLGAWRLYADQLELRARQAEVRAVEEALSASGMDDIFDETRAQEAIKKTEREKASVQQLIAPAQAARQRLDQIASELEESVKSVTEGEERKRLEARLEIAREAREFADRIAVGDQVWSATLEEALRTWKIALAAAQNPGRAQYLNARKQADELLSQGDPWREQIRRYLQDARARLDELESQPKSKDAATRELEEQRTDLVRQRVAQLRDISTLLENLLDRAEQIRAESKLLLARSSVSERVTQGVSAVGEKMTSFWNRELFTTEEKIVGQDGSVLTRTRGISVGKIILGILGLAAGLFIAKTVARLVKKRLGNRFAIDTARAAFLEKILYYFLLALVALVTLNWLRIPLTAFAFLGGALAIGVGFGAQTLMNNFISGLILLAEQKIKIGDIIDADGHLGRVINLGTRCSRIRKSDGVDVLVPNSYLLEKNVINWTLSDPHHRYDFIIGVSYGVSTELVLSTLRRALEEQPEVLKEPPGSVIFEAFGNKALNFHLYYWLDLGRSDSNEVGSEIRVRIDRLCREAGIEIA